MKRGGFDTSRANPKARASFDMDRDRAFERSSRGSRDSKDEVVEKALEIDRRPPNELVVGLLAGATPRDERAALLHARRGVAPDEASLDVIDDALVRLVERATPSKLVALTRRMRERVRLHG